VTGPSESGRPPVYSTAAVWDLYEEANTAAILSACRVERLFELNPDARPRDAGCIIEAMRASGASGEAVRFFESTQKFLGDVQEMGAVDLGLASAPWVNMSHGETVFLNGTPPAILVSSALDLRSRAWEQRSDYAELLRRTPNAFPWPEYARMGSNESTADGMQRIVLEFSFRPCRACPDAAWMPVAFVFDTTGVLARTEILAPKMS
jgi:hypothetical protein